MARIACAHPGKIGDALYALPAIRALVERHGCRADFYTSAYCAPLGPLFEAQDCIERFVVAQDYRLNNFSCGGQPWQVPVPNGYDAVYQMGFRDVPNRALHDHIARSVGLPDELPIRYDFEPAETLSEPYLVLAARGQTSFLGLFRDVVERSPLPVVEIGGTGDATGSERSIDRTGLGFLETLPWIAGSVGFVGLMSAPLVLANGFPIPRVAPHDGVHWDMSHAPRTPYNHYPVNPTARGVLHLLGCQMEISYCKTLNPEDYEAVHEMQHALNVKGIVSTFGGRFEHPHRAWEYGIVLRALRENETRTLLDVGGGGSVFAPAAAWVDMEVTEVDPGGYGGWVAQQSAVIRKPISYVQQDFLAYEGGEFDAVSCISVLEHIPDDEGFFRKLARHVRRGGILALTVDFWPDAQQKSGGHIRTYNAERLASLAGLLEDFEPMSRYDYDHVGGYVYGYTFASLILRRRA